MGYYNMPSSYSKPAQNFVVERLHLRNSFNTVEEIILAADERSFDLIAEDIHKKILSDFSITADILLCNMKGQLIGE